MMFCFVAAAALCAAALGGSLAGSAEATGSSRGMSCGTIRVHTLRHAAREKWKIYRVHGTCAKGKATCRGHGAVYRAYEDHHYEQGS